MRTLLIALILALTALGMGTAHAEGEAEPTRVDYAVIGDSLVAGSSLASPLTERFGALLGFPTKGRPGVALTTDETPKDHAPLLDTLVDDLVNLGNPRTLIVNVGVNDLRFQTVGQLIDGYIELRRILWGKRTRLLLLTVAPRHPFTDNVGRPGQPKHKAVNDWIRQSGINYVDLDRCIGTLPRPYVQLRERFDSGDHTHWNAAGHRRVANCIRYVIGETP